MPRVTTCIAALAITLCLPCLSRADVSSSTDVGEDGQFALDPGAVVVLPVEALSTEPKYAILADSVRRALELQIAGIEGIHLIDPRLVVPFTATEALPSAIGRLLGAATVIQSTVATGDPGYRIRINCIEARTGNELFSVGVHHYLDWVPGTSGQKEIEDRVISVTESIEYALFPDRRPNRDKEFETARTTLMDGSRSEKERLLALNDLRPPTTSGYPQQYIDDGAALGGDVAIVAAQIASESNAAGIRAGIWYAMTGVPDPVLIQPLIHSLGNDAVALVRERAALALAIHNYDLGARAALESAGNNDPDQKVRHAAKLAASTEEGRRDLLQQIIVDIDVPERERRRAIFHRSQLIDVDAGPPDEALIAAMVVFAKTASETRTRQMAWFRLGSMAGPEIVDDLIAALTDEPSETVREWIVTALEENIDEPGVRAALENTRLNDTSLLVRSIAERALQDAN